MKTLYSAANGAITVTEDQGKISLNFDESLNVGGGDAAGIVSIQGKGSICLNGAQGLTLAAAFINAHIPAQMKPFAAIIETIVNQSLTAIE
jgi:hypothetical protein